MTDKVIDFKTKKAIPEANLEPPEAISDETPKDPLSEAQPDTHYVNLLLEEAAKRGFRDVILIGISEDSTKCMLTVDNEKAIFELSHALYQLNKMTDEG